ncbi:hypothetical protein BV20DRAFT_273138 [Pilatotrama ljubarskyi]|nr:hypothetical protein BV20DRAFT_273138 [Pilatotrama ljubarskyi]
MPRYVVDLNNYLQKQGQLAALRWTEVPAGAGNNMQWTASCILNDEVMGTATSKQKSAAKEEAARQTLVRLGLLSE